jgi:hypothetical protein
LPVPGLEGRYEVSDQGRLRQLTMDGHRILPCVPLSTGYARAGLKVPGIPSPATLHRVVLLAFVGPLPPGQETRHLDGDKTNNALSNLTYGTSSENKLDTIRLGRGRQAAPASPPRRTPRRPSTEPVRNRMIAMRLTDDEYDLLAREADQQDLPISRYARRAILLAIGEQSEWIRP